MWPKKKKKLYYEKNLIFLILSFFLSRHVFIFSFYCYIFKGQKNVNQRKKNIYKKVLCNTWIFRFFIVKFWEYK